MALLTRKRLLLAKIESTYGTDPVPVAGTDDVLVSDLSLTPLQQEYVSRDLIRAHLGNFEQLPTSARVMAEFSVELAGFPTPGTPIASISALLRSCGMGETIDPGVDVGYEPVSGTFSSCTIYMNLDGVLHKLTGARGTWSFSLESQQIPRIRFSMTGLFNTVVDAAQGTPNYLQQQPLVATTANTPTFSLQAITDACLQSLSLDLGNTVEHLRWIGCDEEIRITDRRPSGSATIEAPLMASKNWFAAVQSAAVGALQVIHGAAGNRVTIDAPSVQATNPRYGDQQGIATLQMDLNILPDAGNDDIALTFD